MNLHPGQCVAIFGGAVAGAEAAEKLSRQGIYTVVFEQNALPYGKIEDGLPKWHVKLRDKEEAKIDEKLTHPYVQFVPMAKLGRDLDFATVAREWGFSAVLLATGAWRDRPLPVAGIDDFDGKGLLYQNPFIYWFNHHHEPDFAGTRYAVPDGAIVVGGGLASIDVVKVLQLETLHAALAKHGHAVDVLTLEKNTPARVLADLNLTLADLGMSGCTLYYRRTVRNMPLNSIPEGAEERRIAKAEEVRERMMTMLQEKYLFRFIECHMPVDKIVEDGRLAGLVFQQTKVDHGKVRPIDGAFVEVKSPLVISSIGSIPEPISGVPAAGSVFGVEDEVTGRLKGFSHVFALGNAVTGRGNIKESRLHGAAVSDHLLNDFLCWKTEFATQLAAAAESEHDALAEQINTAMRHVRLLTAVQIETLLQRAREMQERVGYDGDYAAWRKKHLPARLEDMLARA